MNQVYVITYINQIYDDAECGVIKAFTNRQSAQNYLDMLQKESEDLHEQCMKYFNDARQDRSLTFYGAEVKQTSKQAI